MRDFAVNYGLYPYNFTNYYEFKLKKVFEHLNKKYITRQK